MPKNAVVESALRSVRSVAESRARARHRDSRPGRAAARCRARRHGIGREQRAPERALQPPRLQHASPTRSHAGTAERAFRAVASRRSSRRAAQRSRWREKSPSSLPYQHTSTARSRSPSPASSSPAAPARRRPRGPGARPSSSRQRSATHLDSSRRWSDCERDAAAQCIAARSEACAGLAGTARPPRGEGDSVAVERGRGRTRSWS